MEKETIPLDVFDFIISPNLEMSLSFFKKSKYKHFKNCIQSVYSNVHFFLALAKLSENLFLGRYLWKQSTSSRLQNWKLLVLQNIFKKYLALSNHFPDRYIALGWCLKWWDEVFSRFNSGFPRPFPLSIPSRGYVQ